MKISKGKIGLLLAGTVLMTMGLHAGAFRASGPVELSDSVRSDATTQTDPRSVVDEVVWVVGDEPILKSEVEIMKLQGEAEGTKWGGDPDCIIPEHIAVQKLFLHQAALDSIEVTESEIAQGIDQQINYWISLPQIGSKEKLEAFQHKSLAQIRQDLHDDYKNRQLVQRMQEKLVGDIKVSPAEVREYFKNLPVDSIPMIPTTVEVEILTQTPKVEPEEVNRIKNQLRDYTDRVTKGETSFATLARLYSEDPGSARQGGELGYMGRGMLDPAFAAAAFNLTDPKKVSKIVESEFGYHIIQLVDKRGDKVNVRHILLKPHVSMASIDAAKERLDSINNDIKAGKFTFEDATAYLSDDKDTKNNHGLMVNSSENVRTSRFKMKDLPSEVARVVEGLKVGEVSAPFQMVDAKGKVVCAIVKLKSRIPEHRATITEDFQAMKDIVVAHRRQEMIHNWVEKKIKETYVRINPRYQNCKFQYEGWVK
jgi:PPIC-type PPIASE domain protein